MAAPDLFETRTWRVTPDLLAFVDHDGRFVETNPAWKVVLGWSLDEIRAMVFTDFLHPDDMAPTLKVFEAMQRGEPALHFENRYRCKDGSYRWLSWVAAEEGDMFFCSARDITDDKARVRALRTSDDEALLREQFIAILGHDLRNPLAAIGSAVRIASREPHSEKIEQMLSSIQSSADRMAKLIDVTMDFARARLGEGLSAALEPTDDLSKRFELVVEEIRLAHPDRVIEFKAESTNPILCDAERLCQMLSNLLGNAVTHGSRRRPIEVEALSIEDVFELSVANAGSKIPDNVLPTLFEPFSRGGDDSSLQGLGLGLYISDQIAKAHGGTLEVESTEDRTRFCFKLEI
ncbi:PAS domain-containing sensor histidine kinase [Actibacterium sp. 188UL27-1]|uniref:PAS domain-containing sensor histidine kinase n=1 Tax=Actibacterium sp. 188UL27-1 TaxID=2786961 RepID=UPI001EF4278D|nr:PAS domain-containing sensor histidine kinase [Actibacterium sp. 188UL27-1]